VIAPRAILLAARKAHDDLGDFLSFLSDRELEQLKQDALVLLASVCDEKDARDREKRAA
jgi:hypothetical protein